MAEKKHEFVNYQEEMWWLKAKGGGGGDSNSMQYVHWRQKMVDVIYTLTQLQARQYLVIEKSLGFPRDEWKNDCDMVDST